MKHKLIELAQYMDKTDVSSFVALSMNSRHIDHREAAEYCLEKYKTSKHFYIPYISDENYLNDKIKFVNDLAYAL